MTIRVQIGDRDAMANAIQQVAEQHDGEIICVVGSIRIAANPSTPIVAIRNQMGDQIGRLMDRPRIVKA